MLRVNAELSLFDSALAQKPQLVVINKVDLPSVQARLAEIKDALGSAGTTPLFISAATGEGVAKLMVETLTMLQAVTEAGAGEKAPGKIFHPLPRKTGPSVHKEGNTFVIVAPELERIVARTDMTSPKVREQFKGQLVRLRVNKALGKAGVKPGDRVRCGNYEWEWQ